MTERSVNYNGKPMAPRNEAEFERIRNESRDKILRAALELFARNGYAKTTISSIAKSAGVAKGLIYNYFDNKDMLLQEAFTSSFKDIESTFAPLYQMTDPVKIVEFFIDGFFDLIVHDASMWRLQSGILLNPDTPPKLREDILSKLHGYTSYIQEVFKNCGISDPEGEAWVFVSSLDGVMLYYLFLEERIPLDKCRKTLKDRYRHLLGSHNQ